LETVTDIFFSLMLSRAGCPSHSKTIVSHEIGAILLICEGRYASSFWW